MTDQGKVFNVKHVNFTITNIDAGGNLDFSNLDVDGIAPDGFGVTPTAETNIIEGFKGEHGFSVDPSDGAEISLTLKSTSDTVPNMIELYQQQQLGNLAPFTITISVSPASETGGTNAQSAFGFSTIEVANVMFVNYAPFETEERDAPDYSFEFIGYGLRIDKPEVV